MNNNYCVIMAGGVGSRFWPLSTNQCPKQFLDPIGTGKSFLRSTFERLLPIIPKGNFLVMTAAIYKEKVLEHLPELREDQVLLEPVRRNTAPCIAYAMARIEAVNPAARVMVAPSDHMITGEHAFLEIVKEGLDFVDGNEKLLTIGIKPSRPETGYGYIQVEGQTSLSEIQPVKTFTEKPDAQMARVFVESGEFLWNSGMFIWSVMGIRAAFRRLLPDMANQFEAGRGVFATEGEQAFINDIFPHCQNISIDYGVMEKATEVYVKGGDFGWSDIGTWGSVYQLSGKDEMGNLNSGKVLTYDTEGTIVNIPADKVAVVQGLKDYIVVQRGQSLLICKRDEEQRIRNWVEDVKYKFSEDYV